MAENWVNIEDDLNIIDAELDESNEVFEYATLQVMKLTMPWLMMTMILKA